MNLSRPSRMTASTKSQPNDAAPPSCRSRQTGRYMGCVRIPPSSFRDVREEQRPSCGVEDTGGAHDYNAQQGKSRVAVNLVHFGVDLALCSQPFLVVDTSRRPGGWADPREVRTSNLFAKMVYFIGRHCGRDQKCPNRTARHRICADPPFRTRLSAVSVKVWIAPFIQFFV